MLQWLSVTNDSQPLSGIWKLKIIDDHGSTMCELWPSRNQRHVRHSAA